MVPHKQEAIDGAASRDGVPLPTLDQGTLDPSEDAIPAAVPRRAPGAVRITIAREPVGLTDDGRLMSGRLAGLSMGAAIWVLSWPILVESLLNSMVGLTDTFLAAQLSEAATDAIGGASYIMWLVGLIIMAIGVGTTAMVSRSVGGRRLAVANAAVGQSLLLAVVSGVGSGLLVAAAAPLAAAALNLHGQASEALVTYMRWVALGVPFTSVLATGIACARGAGDSLRPLMAMVVVNVVNMGLSWALAGVDYTTGRVVDGRMVTHVVVHNPFGFHMGVSGIALGTVVAEGVGTAIIVGMLLRGVSGVAIKRRRLRPHWHTIRRLVRVGLPSFFETLGMWAGNFLVILMVGMLGAQIAGTTGAAGGLLGAHIVAVRIEAFSYLPGFAMGAAAATLAGQYLGAGSPSRARRSVLVCTLATAVVMGGMGMLFLLVPGRLVGLMSSQPAHLTLAPRVLFIAGMVQVPFGVGIVLRSAMRGAGDVKAVMWLTWLTTYGVRLPLAYLLCGLDVTLPAWLGGAVIPNPFHFDWGLPASAGGGLIGLWVGLCAELVMRGVVFAARFVHGGWLRARV